MDMGKGALRKRGHHVPEDCCLCTHLPQIRPGTATLWEAEPFSFHQGCPQGLNTLKGLHGATGIYLGPEIVPSENTHYPEALCISCSLHTRETQTMAIQIQVISQSVSSWRFSILGTCACLASVDAEATLGRKQAGSL